MIKSLEHPVCASIRLWIVCSGFSILINICSTAFFVKIVMFNLILLLLDGSSRSLHGCIDASFSTICSLSWLSRADEPLIQVFTSSNAHHLLLQTEISLRYDRLKLTFAPSMAQLVCLLHAIWVLDPLRVEVFIYDCASILRAARTLASWIDQRIWLLLFSLIVVHLLELLLYFLLFGQT